MGLFEVLLSSLEGYLRVFVRSMPLLYRGSGRVQTALFSKPSQGIESLIPFLSVAPVHMLVGNASRLYIQGLHGYPTYSPSLDTISSLTLVKRSPGQVLDLLT